MSLAPVIVEVFTDTPLQGNQLAVFEDGSALSDDQMQRRAPGDEFVRDRLAAASRASASH
jgi:predicted PhzF superfamily epimerase YddE/YHI9